MKQLVSALPALLVVLLAWVALVRLACWLVEEHWLVCLAVSPLSYWSWRWWYSWVQMEEV